MKNRDDWLDKVMRANRIAAEEAARSASAWRLHGTAPEEAARAVFGLRLHTTAVEEAARAAAGLRLHRSAIEAAAGAVVALQLNRPAVQAAAEAVAALRLNYTGDFYKQQLGAAQLQLLGTLNVRGMGMSIAEIAEYAVTPLFTAKSSAQIAEKIAQSFHRSDLAAMGVAALRHVDAAKISGNSIATAFAAFQAEQIKGLESLRASFAGIAADALKQGLLSLNQRDEEAFFQFEQLIDEKIASLPHNQVTAESLLGFLLMLFIALGSLGADAFQVENSIESNKIQAEQHAQVMSVIERIATSTGRLTPEQDQNIYYVAERKVSLKLKPGKNSSTVTTIFPNQRTRLVQMSHQWIYIEYFDYLEALPKYGWAYKKYLKRQPTSVHISDLIKREGGFRKDLSASFTREEWVAITDQWDQTNARRVELIHKKIENIMTVDEKRELDALQSLTDMRIRQLAPLPIKSLESNLETLKRGN